MHDDKKRCSKNRKIRGVRVKIEEYQSKSLEDLSASKGMGTIRTKWGKWGRIMGRSQVRRNKNSKQKKNSKGNSKTDMEYNKTIRIGLIQIFIDYVGVGA